MSNTKNKRKRSKSPAPSPSVEEQTDGLENQGNPTNNGHLEPSVCDNSEESSVKTSVQTDGCNDRPQNAQTDDLPSVEELLRQSRTNSNGRNGGTEADGTDGTNGDRTNSADECPKSNHSNGSRNSKQRKSPSNDRSGDGAIAKKASDTLASKTSQQAQELIKADKRSKQ